MKLDDKQIKVLTKYDSEINEVYSRFQAFEAKLEVLRENRDVANDYVEDTLSFDQVIQKIASSRDAAAYRLNWACKQAGLGIPFNYVS